MLKVPRQVRNILTGEAWQARSIQNNKLDYFDFWYMHRLSSHGYNFFRMSIKDRVTTPRKKPLKAVKYKILLINP